MKSLNYSVISLSINETVSLSLTVDHSPTFIMTHWGSLNNALVLVVFKWWWSEYHTKFSSVFKWRWNAIPFGDRTFDHWNTRPVWYSGLHCSNIQLNCEHIWIPKINFNFNNNQHKWVPEPGTIVFRCVRIGL